MGTLGPSVSQSLAILAQDPPINDILNHPDFRQIAAFCLGWVFITSLSCIIYSSIVQSLLLRITFYLTAKIRTSVPDPEAGPPTPQKSPTIWTTDSKLFAKGDNQTLLFILCLCFFFASVAQFSSLLVFDPNKGAAACAFLVAWGGMAAQSARLIGLLILSFELRQLGIRHWETILLRAWLGIGLAFIFVANAINTGTIKTVPQLGVSFCYRRRFLPTSLVSSFIYFILELYVVIRLALLIAPVFLHVKHRIGAMKDLRVLQGLSLMLLELLTIVPTAIFTGIVGEFIPFSIGALAVLAAFNHHGPKKVELRVTSMPSNIGSFSPPNRLAAPTAHSVVFPVDNLPQVPESPYKPCAIPDHPFIPNHPYAANSLNDSTLEIGSWEKRTSGHSSRTIDTVTAKSITNAVIQVASKGSRAPLTQLPKLKSILSSDKQESKTTPRIDDGLNMAPSQPYISRHILPDQAKYAEQFERPLAKKARLSIIINTNSPALQSWPSGDPITPKSPRSPSSVVYGSDIIRVNPQSGVKDAMKRSSHTAGGINGFRTSSSYIMSSPRETLLSSSAPSTRRFSWASMVPPSEDLPALYEEVAGEATSKSEIIPRPRVTTFGEHIFENNFSSFVSQSRTSASSFSSRSTQVGPGGQRSSGIRGPRPPPLSPGRRYMTPTQLVYERYRRRRSGSLPVGNKYLDLDFGK